MSAVNKKTWKEFRATGLLWFINQQLHLFGWAIVVDVDLNNDKVREAYPARVVYRGFAEGVNEDGYQKVSKYLKDNIDELEKESQ